MKAGMIGTGNMGEILVNALIDSGAIAASDISVINRTKEKALRIQNKHPDITVCDQLAELVRSCDLIFICVKPHDIFPLLDTVKEEFTKEKCAVSITSPVSAAQLESVLSCSCARMIPSITNKAMSGAVLYTFGDSCSSDWRKVIMDCMMKFSGYPVEITEDVTRAASDIVSCGPAFMSYLTRQFIEGAATTGMDKQTAEKLAEYMLIGLGELFKKGEYSLAELEEKVCVKGGVTGKGIEVLEKQTGDMFENLFKATHEKFAEDKLETSAQFGIY
ncbi:competence protein ComER [Bacillus ectoiniformans]|uniref:late competence protein ComER n=1 Tax=Bacillus ectoiniformans TaxID=1494429 RepID=UPI00195C3AA3|nr:late competence protein ComER [Bacillus ectoiniformans]MBM7649970.1 competence protein ComER [Bacillus ectoiniformans]